MSLSLSRECEQFTATADKVIKFRGLRIDFVRGRRRGYGYVEEVVFVAFCIKLSR